MELRGLSIVTPLQDADYIAMWHYSNDLGGMLRR